MKLLKLSALFAVLIVATLIYLWTIDLHRIDEIIDDSQSLDEDDRIESEVPSLPAKFWGKSEKKWMKASSNCMLFGSDLSRIKINNRIWQVFTEYAGNFYIYGAYLDDREEPAKVRILGMFDGSEPSANKSCQLWNEDAFPTIVPVTEIQLIWRKEWSFNNGLYNPYLISCNVPPSFSIPKVVSLVEDTCDRATNSLKVNYNKENGRKQFGVCVKGLDFPDPDFSVKLIEWIELLRLLGADKVFVYNLHTHPAVSKVLRYYEAMGRVESTDLTLPGTLPNTPWLQHLYLRKNKSMKRLNELITYNDCLYRNMYKYEYLALLDVDEVIMPKFDNNWFELIQYLQTTLEFKNVSSFAFANMYYFDNLPTDEDVPNYMYFLRHTRRSKNPSPLGSNIKCFVSTDRVVALHNHYPIACLGKCNNLNVDPELAQLNHYRSDCVHESPEKCKEYKLNVIEDKTIVKFSNKLIESVKKALANFKNIK